MAVETWTLEILSHLMSALDLAHNDDPALGTHEQTKAAILHVRRILIVRKELFWKVSELYYKIDYVCNLYWLKFTVLDNCSTFLVIY